MSIHPTAVVSDGAIIGDGVEIGPFVYICLISPSELIALLPPRMKYTETQLDNILSELALDDYFELLSSERKGEKMYVISLRANGYAYKRCSLQQRRNGAARIFWAVTSAIVAFLVGLLLKRIF